MNYKYVLKDIKNAQACFNAFYEKYKILEDQLWNLRFCGPPDILLTKEAEFAKLKQKLNDCGFNIAVGNYYKLQVRPDTNSK